MFLIVIGIMLTLAVIFFTPFLIYSMFAAMGFIKQPKEDNPLRFLLSIVLTKLGLSITFVILFYIIFFYNPDSWFIYGLIWFISAIFGEIGDSLKHDYTYKEAILGIISEAIYFPLSAFFLSLLFK